MENPAARTSRRPLLVLAWLASTVLGGVVAWSAVTVVAGERSADGPGVLSQAQVASDLAEAAEDGTAPAGGTPAAGATPTPDPGAATAPAPDAGTAPPATGAPDGAAPGTAPPGTAPPGTSEPGTAPPGAVADVPPAASAQEVARTWPVDGGQVGAVCTGATIRLLYATPGDGWTVEVDSAGPEEVEVDFTQDGARSRVRAECVAGTPELGGGGTGGGGGSGSGGGGGGDSDDDRGDDD